MKVSYILQHAKAKDYICETVIRIYMNTFVVSTIYTQNKHKIP